MSQKNTTEDCWSNKDIIDLDKVGDRSFSGLVSKMIRCFMKRVFDEGIATDNDLKLNQEIERMRRKI